MRSTQAKPSLTQLKQTADEALEQREFPKALALYQQALALDPDNAELYKCLGRVYHDQDQLEQAETYYHQAIEKDPNYWAPYNNLGNIYKDRKDFNEAIRYFKLSITAKPDISASYMGLGNVYCELTQFVKAQQYYNRAIELEPNEFKNRYNQACSFKEQEKFERAAFLFENLLSTTPENRLIDVYANLAYSYSNTKRPDYYGKAMKYFHLVIPLAKPEIRTWAFEALVWLYWKQADYEQAFYYCLKAAESLVETEDNELKRLNELVGHFAAFTTKSPVFHLGIKYLLEYALIHPTSALAHYYLAWCYNYNGNHQKAIKHGKIAIALDPTLVRAYEQLEEACCYTKDPNKPLRACIAHLKATIAQDSNEETPATYRKLALAYRCQGNEREAVIAEKQLALLQKYQNVTLVKPLVQSNAACQGAFR